MQTSVRVTTNGDIPSLTVVRVAKKAKYDGMLKGPSEAERSARKVFGAALDATLNSKRLTQADLAGHFGSIQSTVSQWVRGEAEPRPVVVFAIEQALELEPGTLSQHLGYLPIVTHGEAPADLVDVLDADSLLSDSEKDVVRRMYEEFVGRRQRRARGG
jgi:transcriptional regulator with XRE-family HTH domain